MNQKLVKLIADLFEISEDGLTEELAIEDLEGWDSLKHMELIASIEEGFGIELTFDEILAMQSLGKMEEILKTKGALD